MKYCLIVFALKVINLHFSIAQEPVKIEIKAEKEVVSESETFIYTKAEFLSMRYIKQALKIFQIEFTILSYEKSGGRIRKKSRRMIQNLPALI